MDGDTLRRFRDVYDETFPTIYAYFARRVGDRSLAEDLAQETFAAAARELQRTDVDTVTAAWLMGVARNKLVDWWRRVEREEARVARWRAERRDAVELEPGERVLDALASLAPTQRAVLVLHYLDDVPVVDVARLIDKSVAATESLLARARTTFRGAYGEDLVDA